MRRQLSALFLVMAAVAATAGCGARLSKAQVASAVNGVQNVSSGGSGTGTGSGSGDGATGGTSDGSTGAVGVGDAGGGAATGPSGGAPTGGSATGSTPAGGSGGPSAPKGGATATTVKAGGAAAANTCPNPADNGGASDVGVTATEIKLGNVSTIGGPVPGLFKGAQLGAQAFLTSVNGQGGICGRKLTLITKDDGLDASANKSAYQSLSSQVFAFLGSFSTASDGGYDVLAANKVPDVSYVIGAKPLAIPNIFTPAPLPPGWNTGALAYYKKRFPDAVTKMAYFTLDADQARTAADGEKSAAKSLGYNFIYEKTLEPTETGYDQYAQGMKSAGARGIMIAGDVATMANLAKALKNQNYDTGHGFLGAYAANTYDPAFISLAGDAGNGSVLTQSQAMFQGEDAAAVPEIANMIKYYRAVGGKTPDLFAMYSWASGMLLRQGLQASGPKATRQGLIDALSQVHSFNAGGMLPDEDVAGRKGTPCYMIIEINAGRFVRSADNPSGFRCGDGPYFTR